MASINRHSREGGNPVQMIVDKLDLWTAAIKNKSTAGRGSSSKVELYGIKKLRELILELAVRGLLVPQDPNDEPASELLKKVGAEKAKLVKEGKIRKEKPLPPIAEGDEPFKLPSGWLWERLQNISFFQEGPGIMAKDFRDAGVPLVRIAGMHNEFVSLDGCNFLDEEMVEKKWGHFRLNRGDILLSSSASLGKVSKVGSDAAGAIAYTGLIRFKPYKFISDDFLIRFFESNEFARQINDSKKGAAIMHFGPSHLRWMIVPVPPLEQQHRIVAKVDELLALCDQLEQQTEASLSAHQTLVATLLNALTSAVDHKQFVGSWQRIAEHFDSLFTTEESIDQLKQAILQLAVMGKLVPQDPNDEPASELLKKIAAEKAKLVKEGKIKTEKPLPPIGKGETLLELPKGWKWVRLGDIASGMDSGWSPACLENKSPSDNVWGVLKTTAVQVMQYLEYENKELPPNLKPRPEAEAKVGDILFTRAGPTNRVGVSCLVDKTRPRLMISDKIIRFHPIEIGVYGRFLALSLNSGGTAEYLEKAKSGMAASQVNISQEKLKLAPVPLSPIPEQHRIVAKVDELITLCNQLKFRLNDAHTNQLHMADAVTEQALG